MAPILCGPADIIWVYHTLTLGVAAWWTGLLRRVPFIFDIQDMYPESLSATGIVSSKKLLTAVAKLADFVYNRSSAITVISPGFKENLVTKGVPPSKIHYVPNGVDESIYRPVPRDEMLAQELGMSGRFNVVYGGTFGPPQGLRNVLDAASKLTDLPDVQFVLIGDGLERKDLENELAARHLSNVRLLPRQPEHRMPSIYALADSLLVHLIDNSLFEITIPSKVQAYMASGKPLLMSLKGDATNIVLEAGAGVAAQPSNPDDLARAVKELRSMSQGQREAMGVSGRGYFLSHFSTKSRLSKYEEVFQLVSQNGRYRG